MSRVTISNETRPMSHASSVQGVHVACNAGSVVGLKTARPAGTMWDLSSTDYKAETVDTPKTARVSCRKSDQR